MNSEQSKIQDYFKRGILLISIFIAIFSIVSEYFFQILTSLILLNILINWFYEERKPLVILFGYLFSWAAISIGYYYGWLFGIDVKELLSRPFYMKDNLDKAFYLSSIGLFFTALGTKVIIKSTQEKKLNLDFVKKINVDKVIMLYIGYALAAAALKTIVRRTIPGLFQLTVFLYNLKWGIFFLMFTTIWFQNKKKHIFWIIVAFEFVLGFTSYFSQFKEILIFTTISYLSFTTVNKKMFFYGILIGIFLVILGIFWSYVKADYRMFLSGGERAQIVKVSKTEALKKLVSYIPQMDKERMEIGTKTLVSRIFFLEFFSATIRFIPTYKPYFNGENYWAAIKHILMPRFLFPNKPVIDDSEQTFKLTGIYVARRSQGASISVGYTAEAYADFGPFWMFVPLFIIGIIWGIIAKFLITNAPEPVWGYSLIFPMYYFFAAYGKNIIKLAGDTFWFLIAAVFFMKIFIPFFQKFISNE